MYEKKDLTSFLISLSDSLAMFKVSGTERILGLLATLQGPN
jgi:hypothetical protein